MTRIAEVRLKMMKHTIENVDFSTPADRGLPSESAVILCSCGTTTTSGEWDEHRGPTAFAIDKRQRAARSKLKKKKNEDTSMYSHSAG